MRLPAPLRSPWRVATGVARRIGEQSRRSGREGVEKLRESEERFRAAFGSAAIGMSLTATDGRYLQVNPRMCEITGYSEEELIGTDFRSITHPDDLESDLDGLRRLLSGEIRYYYSEKRYVHKRGHPVWVLLSSSVVHDPRGEPLYFVTQAQDVTGRRCTEEALRESEARFRLLAEKTSDLICLHEPDGRYVYISPSCRRLLGYEPEELLGTDPYRLFHPEDAKRIRSEAHDSALEGQGAISVTYRIRKKCGEYIWFETVTEPIVDEEGNVVRLQTSSRDVSDRKRAEEALAEAALARTEFLAEVSHELRTPLTVIRGNAEVGLQLGRGCAHEEILKEIVKEAATMSRMVEDLLFLARSDSLSPPFELEPVAVEPFLAELAKGAEALAQERGTPLEADLSGTGWVRMDPSRVKQAVLALVDNAAKYGAKGGRVSLRSITPDGELRLEVEDGGPGIPAEHLPHVFERFYRVDDTGEPGNGLGLSIARSIAEAHGGRIEAVSRSDEGTRMTLHLPLLAPSEYDPSR